MLALALTTASGALADLALTDHRPRGAGICTDASLQLTFNEPPVPGPSGRIEVCRVSDGKPVEVIELGADFVDRVGWHGGYWLRREPVHIEGNTAEIRLRSRALAYGESYLVRIGPGVFRDHSGQAFGGLSEGWEFATKPAPAKIPDRLTVAADGTGDFCTVQGAVDLIEPHRTRAATIFIRKGVYRETVRISREQPHIHLVGEDRRGTVIACTNNERLNPNWIQRSVVGVEADDFRLENLTVRNTTPYKGSQAEALYLNAQRGILRNADFASFQDTLNLSGRVFVENCLIEGDVDFIWGYGAVCFERCELRALHDGYYVQARNAAGRAGYVYIDCRLTAAPGVQKCWLARIEADRFPASHVAFLNCRMGSHIPAAGWLVTGGQGSPLRFHEFQSTGPGGEPLDLSHRHPVSSRLDAAEASAWLDSSRILAGRDGWDPKAR